MLAVHTLDIDELTSSMCDVERMTLSILITPDLCEKRWPADVIELELRFAASAVDVAVFRVWLATVLVLDSVSQVLIAVHVARSLSHARAPFSCACVQVRAHSLARALYRVYSLSLTL